MLATIGEELKDFHTAQNLAMRSAPGAAEWILQMQEGGFGDHLWNFFLVLENTSKLMKIGFTMPSVSSLSDSLRHTDEEDE